MSSQRVGATVGARSRLPPLPVIDVSVGGQTETISRPEKERPAMHSQRLSRTTALSVHIDAICARNCFTNDPASVLAELRGIAGGRIDVLTETVGIWVCSQHSLRARARQLRLHQRERGRTLSCAHAR